MSQKTLRNNHIGVKYMLRYQSTVAAIKLVIPSWEGAMSLIKVGAVTNLT